MKPSISCQVLDKALLGMNDTVIGNFEIDLGYYSFFSKMSMRERLKVLLGNLKRSNERTDVHGNLQNIINELDVDVKSQMKKINDDNMAKHTSSIKTDAYILNKANAIGNQFAKSITAHKETHKQDSNQKVINQNELKRALVENTTDGVNEITFTTPTARMVNTNDMQIDEEQELLMKVAKEEQDASTTEDNKDAFEDYLDNKFVIKPKYKDLAPQDGKSEAVTDIKENNVADEEQPLTKGKTNAQKMNLEEYDIPDMNKYRVVGYDTRKHKSKHYRLILDHELEDSEYTGKSIFSSIKIYRGKRIKSKKSWIERIFSSAEQYRIVGKFRGGIGVIDNGLLERLDRLQLDDEFAKLDIPASKEQWENNKIDKDMLQTVKISTRVYVLDAMIYESLDNHSKNDPYLKIKLGDFKINDSDNAVDNQDQPMFNKRFE